jgi:peptide deformylase
MLDPLRHVSMTLSFMDDNGTRRVWERVPQAFSELLQHELDHLDGVLMSDEPEGDLQTAFLSREEYVRDRERWDKELLQPSPTRHKRVVCV